MNGSSTASRNGVSRFVALIGAGLLIGAAAALVVVEPWSGPILVALSSAHGVDTGDLVVVPLLVLAVVVARRVAPSSDRQVDASSVDRSRQWRGPLSASLIGVLLVGVGVAALADDNALRPAGGGTFGGTIHYIGASRGIAVGQWSYLALTYDGSFLVLYVDGRSVVQQQLSGSIESSTAPMWIGGNRPYGNYFHGVIDDVRVYDSVLDRDAILADMSAPVGADVGLTLEPTPAGGDADEGPVAAYAFDEGSGNRAVDASGNGNDGTVLGPTWTSRGHSGGALSFDGLDDIVRVRPSVTLDLRGGMTLSGWVQPGASQEGWRAIVQRESDAYYLHASNAMPLRPWAFDGLITAIVVGATAWLVFELSRGRHRWLGERRRSWPWAVAVCIAGLLLDAWLAPSGTLLGPLCLAAWFGWTATRRGEAVAGWLLVATFAALSVTSNTGVADLTTRLARNEGGNIRAVAFGALVLVSGLTAHRHVGDGHRTDVPEP